MKTLIALTATLILSAPVLADNGQASQNGRACTPKAERRIPTHPIASEEEYRHDHRKRSLPCYR